MEMLLPYSLNPLLNKATHFLPNQIIRNTIFSGAALLFLRYSAIAAKRQVYRLPFAKGQLKAELKAAIVIVLFDTFVGATVIQFLGIHQWIHFSPSPFGTSVTFVALYVGMEIWFYLTHRLLHTKWLFFIHRQHHTAKVASPLTSLSFSLLERTILLTGITGTLWLTSLLIPVRGYGTVLYLLVNYALNVWGHLNVELMPESFPRSTAGKVWITTTFHAMHHARFRGHYGQFTTILDRALGTYYGDYPLVQTRAATGKGLKRLSETC